MWHRLLEFFAFKIPTGLILVHEHDQPRCSSPLLLAACFHPLGFSSRRPPPTSAVRVNTALQPQPVQKWERKTLRWPPKASIAGRRWNGSSYPQDWPRWPLLRSIEREVHNTQLFLNSFFHHIDIVCTVLFVVKQPRKTLFLHFRCRRSEVGCVVLRRLPPTHPQHERCLRAATENVRPGFFSSESRYGAVRVLDIYKVQRWSMSACMYVRTTGLFTHSMDVIVAVGM